MNCKVCDKSFSGIECYREHLASKKHIRKLEMHKMLNPDAKTETYNVLENTKGQKNQQISCDLCSKTFYTIVEFQNHSVSEEHARMVLKEKPNFASTSNELPGTVVDTTSDIKNQISQGNVLPANFSRCELCNKGFTGPEPYLQHIASAAHKKKEIAAASPDSLGNKNLECAMCAKCFSGPECYQQHLVSIGHKKKLAETTCLICDEHFADFELYHQHINTDNHKNRAASSTKIVSFYCEVCDIPCSGPIPYDQHLKGEMHKKKMINKNMSKEIADNEINSSRESANQILPDHYCECCKKQCPNEASYKDHLSSLDHTRKYVDTSSENKRKEIQDFLSGTDCKNKSNLQQIQSSSTDMRSNVKSSVGSFLFENDSQESLVINPVNIDVKIFQVGEEIDFDKKKNNLTTLNITSDDSDVTSDQNDEEIKYDDCPSP